MVKDWLKGIDPGVLRKWVSVGVGGIILVLIANVIFSPAAAPAAATPPGKAPASTAGGKPTDALLAYEGELDSELAASLGAIEGAGHVRVSVTLSGSPQRDYVENTTSQDQTTTQKDAQGGTQDTTSSQTSATLAQVQGAGPVLSAETNPEVVGVLIVATGASDPVVRADLYEAASTLLGVPPYKVEVIP